MLVAHVLRPPPQLARHQHGMFLLARHTCTAHCFYIMSTIAAIPCNFCMTVKGRNAWEYRCMHRATNMY